MEGKDNILEELRLISGVLAAVSRITPYGLPDGYFEGLAGQVLDRIRNGETIPGSGVSSLDQTEWSDNTGESVFSPDEFRAGSAPVYSVPEGYFEGFAGKLMNRIKAGQEMGASLDKTQVTGDSFQSAGEELALLSPLLSRIDKKMPFAAPPGYFEDLSALMAARITGDETLSPLLAEGRDKQVYQAPEGYFEGLSAVVLEKVKQQASAPAKVISLGVGRSWWKYSAAAAVLGLILTGGWLWTHTSTGSGPGSVDITNSLPKVSDQEIESYLDTNNVTNNVPLADDLANSTASLDISDNDIKSFLGDVPDGELKQYIDEHGDVKNLATN